jgi:uncharacterized protein (DUF1501 family)
VLDSDIATSDALRHLNVDEPIDAPALDRRRFLQLVGMGMGAGLVAGGTSSLLDHVLGHDPSAWAAGPVGPGDGIVVVIGMFGGNDGLNTVVPFNDGSYYGQHGRLAVPGAQTLPLNGDVGLHPALSNLKSFWDRGQLAIVQGVGYPNPDFSHFNSMAYWMSGVTRGIPTTGWIGRWLDGYLSGGADLYAAAEAGTSVPLHLVGASRRGTVVPLARPDFGAGTDLRDLRMYTALRSMRSGAATSWHANVTQAVVDQLEIAKNLSPHYADSVPSRPLTARLEVAARLINANLGFRVLTAGWGDFDSHANQPDMHPVRMAELNEAVGRFFALLDPAWLSRVTVMTYSEFGRTSWAGDDDGGTDHGSSAPHFVFGQNVKGGLYGARPSLANLGRWDRMPHSVDFRSYYASILDGWLGGGSSTVLGANYENLGLFRAGPGASSGGGGVLPPAVVSPPAGFVPMAPVRVMDSRDGTGGVRTGAMAAGEVSKVPVRGVSGVPSDAIAVVANVTAVAATEPGYFTVFPGQTARPSTSNLNIRPGRPVPNLVVMGIGTDGCIDVFNSHGAAHCLVDVFGYFAAGGAGDRFTPLPPKRLFDTRTGAGVRPGKIAHQSPVDVQVSGVAGVPAGATAVVINLTVVEPESPGWMRMRPAGESVVTDTSNLNFFANDVVPNLTMCKLGANGQITIDGAGAGAHVLGDVFGYFGGGGSLLRTTPPERLLDTRIGSGAPQAPIGGAATARLIVGGRGSIPANATAVVLNVTATNVQGASYVTVWPDGQPMPDTSNLNVFGGQTIANLVVVRLGAGGALQLANPVSACDVIADALGYFVE